MKLQISFIALVAILLCCLFACSKPKMAPGAMTMPDIPVAASAAPDKPVSAAPVMTLDPRDKLIREQSALLKLYEARIKELEETISRGGR